jgi:regulator of protease activity HflC (stomatin/prohibitin superfamily)
MTKLYDASTKTFSFPALRRQLLFVAFGIVLLVAGCSSYYTVEQGERGIVKRWGAITAIAEPGLGFKVPLTDTVEAISVRTEKIVWENITVYSRDVQPANLYVSVNVRLDPAFVSEVYTNYSTNYVERAVWPVVPKVLEEIFGQYQAPTIVSNRVQLGIDFEKALRAKMPAGIIVEGAAIQNVDFSDSYEASITLAANAEAAVKTKENEKRQAQVDAEKTVIEAEAQNKKRRLESDANAYSIKVNGEAEAAAITARGAALRDNPALIGLVTAEKWDGKLPVTMIPGSTVPFVSVGQ